MTNFLQEFLDLSRIDLKQTVYESIYVFLDLIESIIFKRQAFILNFVSLRLKIYIKAVSDTILINIVVVSYSYKS
jgi:hypothetical protein